MYKQRQSLLFKINDVIYAVKGYLPLDRCDMTGGKKKFPQKQKIIEGPILNSLIDNFQYCFWFYIRHSITWKGKKNSSIVLGT